MSSPRWFSTLPPEAGWYWTISDQPEPGPPYLMEVVTLFVPGGAALAARFPASPARGVKIIPLRELRGVALWSGPLEPPP